jgi:hypothetical protein
VERDASLRDLAELIGALLAVNTGRVELVFNQGSLADVYRHERLKPTLLEVLPAELLDRVRDTKV